MANKIQLKRGLKSKLPTLSQGEPAYTTDTREFFLGTGSGNVNMGGSQWYTGTGMSGTSTSTTYYYSACPQVKVGDMFLNTSNGNVYQCTTAGSGTTARWTYKGNIKGATGAKGEQGDDACAVYSTIPSKVGTWLDGRDIYRIVWSFTADAARSVINYLTGNISDIPNYPNSAIGGLTGSGTLLVNERYMVSLSGLAEESHVVADRQQLKYLLTEHIYIKTINPTVYAIIEYVK